MSEELIKEEVLFNKDIECNQYRVRYENDNNMFQIQFAEYIEDENKRNIHYNFEFIAEDFKAIFRNMVISNNLYEDENGRDLIAEAMDELDEMMKDGE